VRHPEVLAGLVLLWLVLFRGAMRLRRRGGRVDYARYMRSAAWGRRRRACLAAAGWRCQVRGCPARARTAHHPDYARLGRERAGDLVALCWPHHRAIHTRARALWRRRQRVSLRQVTDEVLGRWAA
jgi:hypothetical protein